VSEAALTPSEPPTAAKLSLGVKLAFAGPGFAGAAMAIPIGIFMPAFYSDVILAPLGMIALATAVARVFDALTDPIVGWASDRTRSRWGRRKPWIAVGTPLAALFFWLLFSPPENLDPSGAVLWFGFTFAMFFLFQTIEGVPLAALGAELTTDYNERSSVFGLRSLFIALGTMVAALVPVFLIQQFGSDHQREIFSGMAAAYGFLWLALMFVMLTMVSEHRSYAALPTNPLVPGVRRALRNRPFAILLTSAIISAIPGAVPAVLMPYFVRYVLQADEPVMWTGTFLFIYLTTGLLFVPAWLWLARRVGKLRTFISTSFVGVAASIGYYFAGPGDFTWAGVVYFVSGTQAMAGTFLVPAMAADVIDYDELRTGLRREAQYTSFWSIIPKLISIPGYSIPLAVLAGVGYVPGEMQTPEVQWTIRFLYSLSPASFFIAALFIMMRYPISDAVHAKIRDGIAAHGRGEPATDPLTGAVVVPHRHDAAEVEASWFLDTFSEKELRLAAERGPASVLPRVLAVVALTAILCVGAALLAASGVESLAREPHPLAVVGVVVAGLAFTAFVFHALRVGPAVRLARAAPSREKLAAHLAATH